MQLFSYIVLFCVSLDFTDDQKLHSDAVLVEFRDWRTRLLRLISLRPIMGLKDIGHGVCLNACVSLYSLSIH